MNDVSLLDESVFCCVTQKLRDKEQLPWFCSESKSSLLLTPKCDLQHSPHRDFLAFIILKKVFSPSAFLPSLSEGIWPKYGKSPFHACSESCIITLVKKGQSGSTKYFSKSELCFGVLWKCCWNRIQWDDGHGCFLFFSTPRWVKFGTNWSRSWAASSWDPAVCQLHHCHLQRETSSPINALSIPHGARSVISEGVGPLPPDVRMNPPNSYFHFVILLLWAALWLRQTGCGAEHTDRETVSSFWNALGQSWCSLSCRHSSWGQDVTRCSECCSVVADASASCTNSSPVMSICTHADTSLKCWDEQHIWSTCL